MQGYPPSGRGPRGGGRLAKARRVLLGDDEPEVGQTLVIDERRWKVTDHSTYANNAGLEVAEWECERADGNETAYLLRESDDNVRWFFTRPIPLSAITLSGGKPFAGAAASLTQPPDTLTFRGRAFGFDEVTDGTYEEEPGERVQKTTWDYWDATHEGNLAIERWADGRIDAYHGHSIDPAKIATLVKPTVRIGNWNLRVSHDGKVPGLLVTLVFAGILSFLATGFTTTVEAGLTVGLGMLGITAVIVSARGAGPLLFVAPLAAVALGVLFHRFPPLTNVAGVALLLAVPAGLASWANRRHVDTPRALGATAAAVGAATLAAGLVRYYHFAPGPRSLGQYILAVGPTALTMIVAAVAGYLAIRWLSR